MLLDTRQNASSPPCWVVRARQALVPSAGDTSVEDCHTYLLDDAGVWGCGDRIEGFGAWSVALASGALALAGRAIYELPRALLLPAFLNAHAHLELSALRGAIEPGLSFPGWLERLVTARRAVTPDQAAQAAVAAVEELIAGGCGFVADISALDWAVAALVSRCSMLESRIYFEVTGFRLEEGAEKVRQRLENAPIPFEPETSGVETGLSPHAPYTTTLPLLRAAAKAAADAAQGTPPRRLPLCIHCDETPEEHEMCLRGTGALREFLDRYSVLPADWPPPRRTPVQWLDESGILPPKPPLPPSSVACPPPAPVLLVHLNEASNDDLSLLARRHASAVVCPRSHRYFRRGAFPLERLLAAGVPAALGTDGLSSNDHLSMWDEIREAALLAPSLNAAALLGLATHGAARALGVEDRYGSISSGRRAAFAVIESPDPAPPLHLAAAREWLFSPASRPLPLLSFGACANAPETSR